MSDSLVMERAICIFCNLLFSLIFPVQRSGESSAMDQIKATILWCTAGWVEPNIIKSDFLSQRVHLDCWK